MNRIIAPNIRTGERYAREAGVPRPFQVHTTPNSLRGVELSPPTTWAVNPDDWSTDLWDAYQVSRVGNGGDK